MNKIIILTDGIRGHYHQSLGIANWLKRLSNAEVETVSVPKFKGVKRFLYLKIFARFIKFNALKWLELVNFSYKDLNADLFISAGSSAAPFCLALAKVYNAKCAVVMTPSVLGVKPFDFAIIPEHDAPLRHVEMSELTGSASSQQTQGEHNALIIKTLGAPNHIYKQELKAQAASFFKDLKFNKSKIIAVLIGGSDANYDVNEAWAERVINNLLSAAEACNAELLITTSRRTGEQVDDKIKSIIHNNKHVQYFLPASKYPDVNPVPAMLGLATHVIATEDSVSMVSEAVTAGFKVGLLRTDKQGGLLAKIKNLFGYGTSRFDKLFDKFIERGMVIDLVQGDFENFIKPDAQVNNEKFNEAERAARFILENMN